MSVEGLESLQEKICEPNEVYGWYGRNRKKLICQPTADVDNGVAPAPAPRRRRSPRGWYHRHFMLPPPGSQWGGSSTATVVGEEVDNRSVEWGLDVGEVWSPPSMH